MTHVGFRYTIEWYTKYSDPPDGLPRVKAEMFETVEHRKNRMDRGEPPVPVEFSSIHVIGDHYCVCIQSINTPMKQLAPDVLARIRKKRLERRINKKYPLFAEAFIDDEINKNPAYYQGITREDLERDKQAAILEDCALYERFLEAVGGTK